MSPVYVRRFLLFSHLIVLLLSAGNGNRDHHDHCPDSFDCGSLGMISSPFTKSERHDCGVLAISGCEDHNQTAPKHVQLINGGKRFQVTKANNDWWSRSISIIDRDFNKTLRNACEAFSYNIHLPPPSPLGYFYMKDNITTFKCNRTTIKVSTPINFFKNNTCSRYDFYFGHPNSEDESRHSLASCSVLHLPVIEGFELSGNPFTFLTYEFTIYFQSSAYCGGCFMDRHRRGICRLDSNGKSYCAIRKDRSSTWRKLGMALGIGVGPWIIFGLFLTLRHCKRKYGPTAHIQLQSINSCADPHPNRDKDTERIFFGVPVFSYKELQEATNNFDPTRKLGEGGFGTVYYGKLIDGREVAVKHLFENNYRRVEQFMNEIEILTRLRHRNLVFLYGCTSRHSRELLLVYEYIPNGTVASHLHGDLARAGLLTWPIRMQIAIETATALAYLHASDIIHRDVKTNNILLDINFSVKVADFGLSRLLPNDVSHVSTAPQGSPGYLDPEYFQLYKLTGKSDVYSFGVVLIELISSMPAIDATRERDEINLAILATKKIQKGSLGELVDPSLGFESDHEVKRMVSSVAELAFQCVQGDNELRPSMDQVLQALKRIEGGNYEYEHLEKGDDGAGISRTEEVHPPSSISREWGQVGFLMNKKKPSSPKSLTEKWESESTTPNASS